MKPLKIGVTGVRGVVGETFTPELVVGFAQDMDADRLAGVDERGEPVGEDYTLVLAALYAPGLERGPVVANLRRRARSPPRPGASAAPFTSRR